MKKIALIEDRYPRQRKFLEQNNINLDEYSDVLENFIEEKASNILENISNNSFDLNEFDIIICHKSVENNTLILGNLKDYCKKSQKTLILFSGGISVNYYDNSEFELLELNSKIFYSQNLLLFLESIKTDNEDIMMLCYGEQWKQNIVANVLEKTNLFIFDIKNGFENTANFQIDANLGKIDYEFYEPKKKIFDEIVQFKESLEKYFTFQLLQENAIQTVVIHHDNMCDLQIFNYPIKFIQSSDDIDTYISKEIINELKNKEFGTIFIKDNLTSNYLELYGLRVAYHIRLSSDLADKRFAPIVIISDFDEATLNRFTKEANILFTAGVYLCKNTKEEIEKYQSLELRGLTDTVYDKFIDNIKVSLPKDTSGSHNIANKWSIYKWAKLLDAKSEVIDKNKSEIENELYFKYLKAKYLKNTNNSLQIIKPTKKGKVLLIDDEWNKGWNDVLKNALQKDGLEFDTFEYDFKDKSNFNLIVQLNHKELKKQVEKSDVIILDLRLLESDHENQDIDSYTGIKILQKIHEINAGIQVIMLTATSKSTILEKLYEKKILGYIKKEHPDDISINTVENINKFINLVDRGLDRKFLKNIWEIQKKIYEILENDIFEQYNIDIEKYTRYFNILKKENFFIFDILDSNNDNKLAYAALSMARFLEAILSIFIDENKNIFWDGEECEGTTVYKQLHLLIEKFDNEEKAKKIIDSNLNTLIYKRNKYLHANENIEFEQSEMNKWFKKLYEIISVIDSPENLRIYDKHDVANNLRSIFNNK